jgi:hypothetical protein
LVPYAAGAETLHGTALARLRLRLPKLNKEIKASLADLKISAQIAELGATVLPGSPADFGNLIAEETYKWAKVVKFSGIKAERSRTHRTSHESANNFYTVWHHGGRACLVA